MCSQLTAGKVSQVDYWTAQKLKRRAVRVSSASQWDCTRDTTPPHRVYAKRGYIPDGRGITYRNRFVEEGASVVLDDDLVIHLTKQLWAGIECDR